MCQALCYVLYMHYFNRSRCVNEKAGSETFGNSIIDRTVIDTRVSLTGSPRGLNVSLLMLESG